MAASKGLLILAPPQLTFWDFNPQIVLTEVTVDSQHLIPSENLILSAGTRSFSVEFSALDFSDPQNNQYAYRLLPFDSEWITTSSDRRIATYTNLDPGKYQLQIKGSNRLGKWSDEVLILNVRQISAWHQTAGFRIIFIIFLIGLVYFAYLVRIKQLNKSKQMLGKMVQERTEQLEQALLKVEEASLTDPLTQLRNRRYIVEHINTDLNTAIRAYKAPKPSKEADLVFFLFDIDHFKTVNDTYGHSAGDAILVQFSEILKDTFRESDILIRWGGEEFLVISRFIDRASANIIADRIKQGIAEHKFDIGDDRFINKTCSIGYATFPFIPSNPEQIDWHQVVDIADRALYAAKHSQRDAWIGISAISELTDSEVNTLAHNPNDLNQELIKIESSIKDHSKIVW